MDTGTLNLFAKMLREDCKLSEDEIQIVSHRLMADEKEFEQVWTLYKNRFFNGRNGVDPFWPLLQELLN